MADSSTADLGKGKRITGGDRSTLADDCASATTAARASARSPLDEPLLRLRPPAPLGVRAPPCAAAGEPTATARRREARRTPGPPRLGPHGRDGAVLTVTLDRPEQLNAQTPATWTALAAVGDSLGRRRPRRRAARRGPLVLRGPRPQPVRPGARRPAAGWATSAGCPPSRPRSGSATTRRGFRWLRDPGIVSVAAVQGHAIGAGCQLALACDLRVLTDDAQLRLPEATLGLVPDLTGTSTLIELVGYSRALEICLTGRPVGAAEAHAMGLANAVVPREQLDAAVARPGAALLAPRRSARAARPRRWCAPPSATTRRRRTPPSGPRRCCGCRSSPAALTE